MYIINQHAKYTKYCFTATYQKPSYSTTFIFEEQVSVSKIMSLIIQVDSVFLYASIQSIPFNIQQFCGF